ncbi:MAG: 5-(carboxyamino)imidazole ribonucleotide mutase [bacterium]
MKIGIIMGSDSDLRVMKDVADMIEDFGVEYKMDIVSAHRTPQKLYDYATTAKERGLNVIIAGAGGAAHLPGMIASLTPLPVIGVPIKTQALSGVDSLYSIVQMPAGVPVASVAIDGGKNAGLLAIQILGSFNEDISQKMIDYKNNLSGEVNNKSKTLQEIDYNEYYSKFFG